MSESPLFIHLRTHSAYSLAEGMFQVGDLVKAVRNLGQPAVAITDTFNTFGALEFSDLAADAGIQPIIGAQVNLADDTGEGEVVVLVQHDTGWANLSYLVSRALMEDPNEPRIDLGTLTGRSDGLILLTGGAQRGFVAGALADGQLPLARARLDALARLFPNRLYIELQRHGTSRETAAEPRLLDLAYELDLPLVATNDCYFATAGAAAAHEVLLCISQSTTLADDSRRRETDMHYLKSAGEMALAFADLPEAIANTAVIARRCAFRVPKMAPILPAFPVPEGMSEEDFLREQARSGLEQRFDLPAFADIRDDAGQKKIYADRLEMELDIIIQMGFAGYFLIVADFIGWAKEQGIPVGPGRGSGAGSLVAYALLITDLDPIRWGLLFERFLNPERVSMPDFDVDFCQDRRDEVINYVQQKYGTDRVAQIITFGSLQARAALRDVGRTMGMPYGQVDRIAKLVPSNPADPVTLDKALETEEDLRRERDNDEQVAELIRVSCQLEGLYRHASTHAAGLVIGDRPLSELVPLYRDPRSDMPVTQFNMKWVEKAGLVKFDFLGLKTLTVLQQTLNLLARRGIAMTLDDIPLEDQATFEMLSRGDTVGVFQLESSGMRDVLRGLKPDRFEDIIAVVALYRPGPMENIPKYVARKHGREEVQYMHPGLEPILGETYGIMIYQEQVQQAAQHLAGYTLGGADILRRAMGKKIKAEMDAQRDTFVAGAAKNDIDARLSGEIFDQISAFAGYGFNKSHAAAYALIAWQTAWFKAHYPAEFLAASMTLDAGNTDKLSVFRQDCQTRGITILPPDVNASEARFLVEEHEGGLGIRYALGAIRNVGMEAMRQLVALRHEDGPFTSLDDFAARLAGIMGSRALENLIKAGALDRLAGNRAQLLAGLPAILAHGSAIRRERESAQENLFGGTVDARLSIALPKVPEAGSKIRLENEFAALGLYISAHPLDDYAERLAAMDITPSALLEEVVQQRGSGCRVRLAGVITGKQIRTSSRGNRFAFLQLTDQSGVFEVTVFSDLLALIRDHLDSEVPMLVKADARLEEGGVRLIGQQITPLDDIAFIESAGLEVRVANAAALEGIRDGLKRDGTGTAQLKLAILADQSDVVINLPGRFRLSSEFRQMLKILPGITSVRELS
ncbi:DNA polymerase III subunit alpha [Alphaproteobacteria bacterium LSUCC0684]